ncbi:MAG: hypothetical protein HOO93_05105 [Methyloglobulus sp.]|nr:hypothetical protein [Methyloglobulus sp.]
MLIIPSHPPHIVTVKITPLNKHLFTIVKAQGKRVLLFFRTVTVKNNLTSHQFKSGKNGLTVRTRKNRPFKANRITNQHIAVQSIQ